VAVDVTVEVTIARPRSDVLAYATEPGNDPAWIGGVVDAELETPPPIGLGAKVRRVAKFLGRRFTYVTEVVVWEPGTAVTMQATSPFPMTIRYEFAENGAGTIARINVRGGGSGFFRLAEPLLARQVKHNVSEDLQRIKRILES
jgi:hypothetical protein